MAQVAMERISYEDLYARWEKGNWRTSELDFNEDRVHWHERFSELERRAALWNYALFLHGEDTVADTLSPYIDAAPREEQKYFLATQQVDEVRHAVFFARFMREVVEDGADSVGGSLERSLPELTWASASCLGCSSGRRTSCGAIARGLGSPRPSPSTTSSWRR